MAFVTSNFSEKNSLRSITIHAFQIRIGWRDYEGNFRSITELLENSPADLNVFPEAAVSGFPYDDLDVISEVNSRLIAVVKNICREKGKAAVLPALVKEADFFYNRTYFISASGETAATYDKIHLIGALHEDRYLTPGSRAVVADFPHPQQPDVVKKIGLATCYDLRFPELFRELTLGLKADLIILPAFWPAVRKEHFQPLLQARSIENQLPVVSCNACGTWGRMELSGGSCAFNAKGRLISSLDAQPGILAYEWNDSETDEWRNSFPALKDARLLAGIQMQH